MVIATTDLIEDWIMMRASLQKQVKMLEAGDGAEPATIATVIRLRSIIADLNVLLKENARDRRITAPT